MLNLTALRGREVAAALTAGVRRMPMGATIGGVVGWSVVTWGATTTEARRRPAKRAAEAALPLMSPLTNAAIPVEEELRMESSSPLH